MPSEATWPAAAVPMAPKMPAPMTAPIDSMTRSPAPRTRFSACRVGLVDEEGGNRLPAEERHRAGFSARAGQELGRTYRSDKGDEAAMRSPIHTRQPPRGGWMTVGPDVPDLARPLSTSSAEPMPSGNGA